MLPLLRRLGEASGPVTIRSLTDSIADEFGLTVEERAARIPSGQENLLLNRLGWARTYMGKAGLIESPRRGQVTITVQGRGLLAEKPDRIDNKTLERFPQFVEWLSSSRQSVGTRANHKSNPGQLAEGLLQELGISENLSLREDTPLERISEGISELEESLKSDLLGRVLQMTPTEFEGLIVTLLLAMGYGQGLEEMAEALGGSGDGGIDGVIHQDPLGLDRVYIQAKRYREGNNVSSPDIRNFIGALNIHRASKGVFVTASQFTNDARQAALGSTVQVVLIDGKRLADLMVRYKVGVLVRSSIELKEIDEGFFTD